MDQRRIEIRLTRAAALFGCVIACLGTGPSGAAEAPSRDRPFPDVPRGHWAYVAVEELRQRGILRGYPPEAPPAVRRPAPKRVPPVPRPARNRLRGR